MSQFFQADGWTAQPMEDDRILRVQYQGENGEWTCYAVAEEEDQQFIFYSICPLKVGKTFEVAAVEFITRANYGLHLGNFEMDYDDGTVRYKTSIDVTDDHITPASIKNIVYPNVLIMDRYLPGLMSVVFANVPPAEAISKIEAS
jgi:hypothetical protein